jgi:type II secretory pathway pseudopilin PulG
MWRTKKQNGYTIVETMIVLAVTGTMLTATVILVSGQISRYRFKEATFNSKQAIQGAINDVQAGYFDTTKEAISIDTSCVEKSNTIAGDSECFYVGKEIKIDTNGKMTITSLYLKDSNPPSSSNSPLALLSGQTTQLPGGVDYGTGTFFVMFRNYPDTTTGGNFVGGAQSVGVYATKEDITSSSGLPVKVDLDDGSRKACLVIGRNNNLDVELEYKECAWVP